MAKKNDSVTDTSSTKRHHGLLSVNAVCLIIGPWKKLFTDAQCKLIIAEALNECTCSHGMQIVGYLITERRLFLVLEIQRHDIKDMLQLFYLIVKKEILEDRERHQNLRWGNEEEDRLVEAEKAKDLFRQYFMINDDLVKLITGRPVDLPYYSPHLARLKAMIHNYNFCSAVDYSGAIGPVFIKFLQ